VSVLVELSAPLIDSATANNVQIDRTNKPINKRITTAPPCNDVFATAAPEHSTTLPMSITKAICGIAAEVECV
jgi:hypothetical protein